MRRVVIILNLLFIFLGYKSYSQNYLSMLSDSLYWDVSYRVNSPAPCAPYGVSGPVRYALSGDTIINAILYKQLKGFSSDPFNPGGCPPFFFDTVSQNLDIFLREDTAAKRVYKYDINSLQEELLFDFSLQQGDSIYLPCFISPNIYFYVDTLYSIITPDGISRNYFECYPRPWQGTTGGFFIEGLGGSMGPFERPYNVFEEGYWLLCVSNLNLLSLYGGAFHCFNFTTGIHIDDLQTEDLVIQPNPVINTITLKNLQLSSSVIITDISGRVIYKNEKITENQIDVAFLKAGLYTVTLSSSGWRRQLRFVKM